MVNSHPQYFCATESHLRDIQLLAHVFADENLGQRDTLAFFAAVEGEVGRELTRAAIARYLPYDDEIVSAPDDDGETTCCGGR